MANNQILNRNIVYLSDTSGTGKWRRIFQESLLECIGQNANIAINHTQLPVLDPRYYQGVRSVTIQRWITDEQLQLVEKFLLPICDQNSAWLIYEIDDVMDDKEIPKFNRGRRAFANSKIQSNIRKMLNLADLVTVTTPYIKQFYHEHYGVPNENIVCIPNLLPKFWIGDRYDIDKKIKDFGTFKNKPRIGVVSSLSHYNVDEIREMKDGSSAVFKDVRKTANGLPLIDSNGNPTQRDTYVDENGNEVKFEDTVEITDDMDELIDMIRSTVDDFQWVFFGYLPPKLVDLARQRKIEMHGGVPIMNYPSTLENLRLQAMIAPVKRMTFNYAKSPIKYMEACAIGVPLYATNCQPYSNYMPAKFLYDSADDLKQKLLKLKFGSAGIYKSIIEDNWKWLNSPHVDGDWSLRNYWLDDNMRYWIDLFKLRQKTLNISLDFFWQQYSSKKQQEAAATLYKSEHDPDVVILK